MSFEATNTETPGEDGGEDSSHSGDPEEFDREQIMIPSDTELTIEHRVAMTLPCPSWRTKRRRKRSVAACALDLGQRLSRAAKDLLENVVSASNESDGISIPVLAIAWLLMIHEISDDNRESPLRRAVSYNQSTSHIHGLTQKFRSLKQLRITQSPTWPPIKSHRDKHWSFAQNINPRDWLRDYTNWQLRPSVSGEKLLKLMPQLQVLWLDQIPCSSFASLIPKFSKQLRVLRIDHVSLGDLNELNIFRGSALPVDGDFSEKTTTTSEKHAPPVNREEDDTHENNQTDDSLKTMIKSRCSEMAIYHKLSHLTITHCDMSFLKIEHSNPSDVLAPIWGHFPNLEALSLAHNKGLTESNFTGLSLLTKLEKLNLSHNALASAIPRIHLHVGHILNLDVSSCGLSNSNGIDRLYSLVRLSLGNNQLLDLASIRGLTCLPDLTHITLLGNPIATLANRATKTSISKRHQSGKIKTDVLHPKTAYRLAVLDLFWQAGNQDIVLDGISMSVDECEKLRTTSYPQFTTPNLDASFEARQAEQGRRRKLKHRSIKLESSTHHPLLSRSSPVDTPIVSFHVANVVDSLPNMVEPPSPAVNQSIKKESDESLRPAISDEGILSITSKDDEKTSKTRHIHLDELNEEVKDEILSPAGDVNLGITEDQPRIEIVSNTREEFISGDDATSKPYLGSFSPSTDSPDQSSHRERHGSPIAAPTLVEQENISDRLKHLAFSPINPRKIDADVEDPHQDLDTSGISVISKPTSEQSEPSTALQSAMMASFTNPDLSRGVSQEDCLSITGSTGALSQSDNQKKYKSAEQNSVFVGPHTYKQLTIAADENMEIYFRMFVFSSATLPTCSTSIFSSLDPDEAEWQMVLQQFPRIQLWPSDRRIQEKEAFQKIGPQGLPIEEEFRRVWRENIIGCGQPALQRLTPTRTARLGFHGEIIFAASRISQSNHSTGTPGKAGSASKVDTERGRPEAVVKERHVILCLSSAALYIITDNSSKKASAKSSPKGFPRPIPLDACFAEALWPHALARHPWSHLQRVSIGFNFQRLALYFSSTSNSPNATFSYTILTCNKHETVKLLKEIQELTLDVENKTPTNVQIENDDPFVLDGLAAAVGNTLGAVCHFQILHQFWKKNDRGLIRRLCVVTDSMIYLLDEDYIGDGSHVEQHNASFLKEWGRPRYCIVDKASLSQIISVQASATDPRALTIAIRPTSRLYRTHNWRILCKDREGAEKLVEDARKAIKLSSM